MACMWAEVCVCAWCISCVCVGVCVCVSVWGCLVCLWLCLRRALLCFNAETAAQSVTVSAVNRLLTFFFIFSYLIHAHIQAHTHALTRAPTYASAGWGPVLLPTFCVYCLNLPIYSFTFRLCPAPAHASSSASQNSLGPFLGPSGGTTYIVTAAFSCGKLISVSFLFAASSSVPSFPPSTTLLFSFWVNKAKLRECATHLIIIIFIVFIYGQHSASETEIATQTGQERSREQQQSRLFVTFCTFL